MGGLADYMGVKKKFFYYLSMLGIIFSGMITFIPYGSLATTYGYLYYFTYRFLPSNVFMTHSLTDINYRREDG